VAVDSLTVASSYEDEPSPSSRVGACGRYAGSCYARGVSAIRPSIFFTQARGKLTTTIGWAA